MNRPTVGVLALQGDVREHLHALTQVGAHPITVRRATELDEVDALILPGGESTTIVKLARTFEVFEAVADRIKTGMPVLGTCAGMVLLADRIRDGIDGQETFGGLDITVRRNAFGRQVDSFETDLDFAGIDEPVHAVFIRAPWVEEVGPGVDVLAEAAGHPVAVRKGPLMATAFHPEWGGDARVHGLFVDSLS
ncbi:MAG TPA: pyridoxal 5'-phosphate synthase glutaminase subunit PdxT [Aeromicrobium sp.]|nr:pyridoxal 5'-phosphate synthase glutaminase subunit PdxT [Aeromicrobium sp.]